MHVVVVYSFNYSTVYDNIFVHSSDFGDLVCSYYKLGRSQSNVDLGKIHKNSRFSLWGPFRCFFSIYFNGPGSTQFSFTKREISSIISYTKIQLNTTKTNVKKSYKLFQRIIESSICITFHYYVHHSTTYKEVEVKTRRASSISLTSSTIREAASVG